MGALTTTSVSTNSATSWAGVLFPTLADFLFITLLVWMFLGNGGKTMLADGDTGWHIRTGDYILDHHAVPHNDIFTFTRPAAQWYAWEWLSDVIFSALHRGWGLKAVALLAGILVCCTATVLFGQMLSSGGNIFFSLAAALLANGASMVHFLARPHLFTFLLLAISLWMLARDRKRPSRLIWLLAPITALWVNLHGGFIALIVCLGLATAGYGLQWLVSRSAGDLFYLRRYAAVTAVCGVATLINPYGWGLHLHIVEYLRSSFVMDTVQEFQSPSFRGEYMLQFELLLLGGIAISGILLAKKRFVEALLILFWAQAALTSVRHVPIFVIISTPLLVAQLSESWNEWTRGKTRNSMAGIFRDLGNEFSGKGLRLTIWGPIAVIVLGMSMTSAKGDVWPTDFPKAAFPTGLVNQYAALLAPVTGPMPRIFTSDQWGDYLTYRFYPRIRVFMDGRSDLFGATFGKEYVQIAQGGYEWESLLDRYRIDAAIVPVAWPLGELLKRSPRWRIVKDDGLGILFERRTLVLMKSGVSAEGSTSIVKTVSP
jgi:hypothetical protein